MLLRKGRQCFMGPVFTPTDPSTCVIIVKKKRGVIVNNCTKERICSYLMPSLIISVIIITCEVCH